MINFPPITRSERTVALRLAALEDNLEASQQLLVTAIAQIQNESDSHSIERHDRELEELRRQVEAIATDTARWQREMLLELRTIIEVTAPAPVVPAPVTVEPEPDDPDAEAEMPVVDDPEAKAEMPMPEAPTPKGKRK